MPRGLSLKGSLTDHHKDLGGAVPEPLPPFVKGGRKLSPPARKRHGQESFYTICAAKIAILGEGKAPDLVPVGTRPAPTGAAHLC